MPPVLCDWLLSFTMSQLTVVFLWPSAGQLQLLVTLTPAPQCCLFVCCCVQGISCVNLVNQKGSEGQLEAAFAAQAKRYASSRSAALTYTAFDFHKELGAANYARWGATSTSLLLALIR